MTIPQIHVLIAFLAFCRLAASSVVGTYATNQFNDYWYTKGAEISRFALTQARYGELHTGDAVLIYVTEVMNPKLQVKTDTPAKADIPVLKLNATRKFYTGIYPYSIMTSIFAPIGVASYPLPLKITFTSQEWCGQVFMQMNLRENHYQVQSRSYFESESDKDFTIEKALTEEALWMLIRLAPSKLPTGEFRLFQGTTYTRLLHRPLAVRNATGSLTTADSKSLEGVSLVRYDVRIPEENRVLTFVFEKEFPYRIQEWSDTYTTIVNSKSLTTHAIRTHTIMTDYWNKNNNSDRTLLQKLGLHSRP